MSPREYWQACSETEIKAFCEKAKTSVENFRQIAQFGGHVSGAMAARFKQASGGMMSLDDILTPVDPQMISARSHRAKCRDRARRNKSVA